MSALPKFITLHRQSLAFSWVNKKTVHKYESVLVHKSAVYLKPSEHPGALI